MKKSLLITGSNGWFGRVFAKNINFIRESFEQVIFLVRKNPGEHLQKLDGSYVKIFKQDLNQKIEVNIDFTHCIHMATPDKDIDDNIKGELILRQTRNIYDFCVLKNTNKFIFLSSGAIYGNFNNKIKENEIILKDKIKDPCLDGYQKGKINTEIFLNDNKSDMDIVIPRCFSYYGEEMPNHYAFYQILKNIIHSRKLEIINNVTRSYFHEDNLFSALMTLLNNNCKKKTYNIGSDKKLTLVNLATKISNLLKIDAEIINRNQIAPKRHFYVPNTELFDAEFRPIYKDNFNYFIEKFFKYYEKK